MQHTGADVCSRRVGVSAGLTRAIGGQLPQ
jgi:hypothetical protein